MLAEKKPVEPRTSRVAMTALAFIISIKASNRSTTIFGYRSVSKRATLRLTADDVSHSLLAALAKLPACAALRIE